MLSADDPRIQPLREQAAAVQVIGMCPCGCATIDLEVDRTRARVATGLAYDAVDSHSSEVADVERVRELILFVKDGWLSSLEVVYYGASPPRLLPDPIEMESPWVPPPPLGDGSISRT
jgi:hypothetical protein